MKQKYTSKFSNMKIQSITWTRWMFEKVKWFINTISEVETISKIETTREYETTCEVDDTNNMIGTYQPKYSVCIDDDQYTEHRIGWAIGVQGLTDLLQMYAGTNQVEYHVDIIGEQPLRHPVDYEGKHQAGDFQVTVYLDKWVIVEEEDILFISHTFFKNYELIDHLNENQDGYIPTEGY